VAREEPYRAGLGGWAVEQPVLAPQVYAKLLYALGFVEQHVRLQVYAHILDGPEGVIEWVKGTLLTEYERRLPSDLWPRFLETYRSRLLAALDADRPFFYPFKRLLLWASRA
jgi:trans-aconitate 2-methyltransferase